jgi:hypothetical protein
MTAEKTASKQRGRPFPKGRSGNPRGRPPGARNSATVFAEQILENEAPTLIRKALQKAKQGNMPALRLCLDRILPPRKTRAVTISLPEVTSAEGVTDALAAVIAAMGDGKLTPDEAAAVSSVIEAQGRALELTALETRMQAIEAKIGTDDA